MGKRIQSLTVQKICKNRVDGSSGTGTTFTGTGTSSSLPVGTGTSLSGTGTTCPLHHGYRYHSLVPVPLTGFAQKTLDFDENQSTKAIHVSL